MHIGEIEEVGTIEPLVIPDVVQDEEAPPSVPPEEAPLVRADAAA